MSERLLLRVDHLEHLLALAKAGRGGTEFIDLDLDARDIDEHGKDSGTQLIVHARAHTRNGAVALEFRGHAPSANGERGEDNDDSELEAAKAAEGERVRIAKEAEAKRAAEDAAAKAEVTAKAAAFAAAEAETKSIAEADRARAQKEIDEKAALELKAKEEAEHADRVRIQKESEAAAASPPAAPAGPVSDTAHAPQTDAPPPAETKTGDDLAKLADQDDPFADPDPT